MKLSFKIAAALGLLLGLISTFYVQNGFCNDSVIPGKYFGHKLAGDQYLQSEKFNSAVSEYENALRVNPKSTATYFNLAIASYLNGDLRGAVSALEKLLKLDPADVEAHYNLGCLKLILQDLNGSKASFEKAKLCRGQNPAFSPLVSQGLEFLDEFTKLDPATQDLNLFFLQASLPAQTLVS